MKKLLPVLLLCGAFLGFGQPVLRSTDPVVNGGSYANTIAPGSIFVVFGTNLAGEAVLLAPSLPLQTSLGGVSIRLVPAAGGAPIDALMVYTTRNQISGLLPSSAAPGDYNVTVTYNNQTSPAGRARVVARNIGVVTADSSGSGQAQAQIFYSATDWSLNRFSRGQLAQFRTEVAHPGELIVLWGTGIGADTSSDLNGGTSGDRTAAANIRVVVGGRDVLPAYAGRASGLPGTDQINFTLPADVPLGCSVSVVVRAGETSSNVTSLAIAGSGATVCTHPYLTSDQLRRVSEGGTLTLGSFALTKSGTSLTVPGFGTLDMTTESVGGSFARYGVGSVGAYGGDVAVTPIGNCFVFRRTGTIDQIAAQPAPPTALDAGAQLRLNGPNASNVAVDRTADKSYYKQLSQPGIPGIPGLPGGGGAQAVIAAGQYTLSGTGGPDVGSFSAQITVPQPMEWTNRASITDVNRSNPLNVTWTGGGSDLIAITGYSGTRIGGTTDNPIFDAAGFTCIANASAGSFSVPAAVLSQLPQSSSDPLSGAVGYLSVGQSGPSNGGPFTAPLTAGGSVDRANLGYSVSFAKTVGYR